MAFFCAGSSGEAKKKNAKPGMEHLHSVLSLSLSLSLSLRVCVSLVCSACHNCVCVCINCVCVSAWTVCVCAWCVFCSRHE